jgi:hypothetical protein
MIFCGCWSVLAALLCTCLGMASRTAASLALGASEFTSSFPDRFSDYTEARLFLNLTDLVTGESRGDTAVLDGK